MKHPSEHTLDRIASGLAPIPHEAGHVSTCERCSQRLESLRREAEAVRNLPGYAQGLAAVRRAGPEPRRFSLSWLYAAGAMTAAVVLAVTVHTTRTGVDPDTRAKGSASLALVAEGDDQPLGSPLRAGQTVQLVPNPGGGPQRSFALVFLVDRQHSVSLLWPLGASESGEIRSAGPLSPGFRVTSGDFLLYGVFSDEPLAAAPLLDALAPAAAACSAATDPACVPLDTLPGQGRRARVAFHVESAP